MVQRGAFDQLGSSHAICNVVYGAQAVFDAYMAAGFCKAINDWIAAEWLAKDPRLSASIVVPMQAPDLAVEEIERRAGDNRFVSVLVLAQGETLLGRRHYWPVWQAAEKHKLPVAIHAGSAYRGAPSSIGWPSYRYEYYLAEAQAFQAQILSLIYEGVFGKFPGLKVVLMESGVSWLPAFMWRANKTWRGVRVEVPWVEREPAVDHPRPYPRHHAAVRRTAGCRRCRRRDRADRLRQDVPVCVRLSALAVRRRRSDAAASAGQYRFAHVRRQPVRDLSAAEARGY